MLIGAFPDLQFTTDFMVAEGDMVTAFNTVKGTHRGEFMGIPGTEKAFSVSNADACRFTDTGLICEHWGLIECRPSMRATRRRSRIMSDVTARRT